jgi:hypothetical protein
MQERRTFHRARTYIGARIIFNHRFSTMDCLVRNLSEDGAKLVFFGLATIPSEFDVFIANNGDSRRVKTIWRTEIAAGIKFLNAGYDQVVPIEAARKLKKLKDERDMLARRIAQLVEPT